MVKFNRIYVTVGTTQFDKLVNVICSGNILKVSENDNDFRNDYYLFVVYHIDFGRKRMS